jgi:hypothetical protein
MAIITAGASTVGLRHRVVPLHLRISFSHLSIRSAGQWVARRGERQSVCSP